MKTEMTAIADAYRSFNVERFPLPTTKQLEDLEKRLGVKLPDDYRAYLAAYNGGYFNEPDIVPPTKECPEDGLTFMHGIGASHPTSELANKGDLALFTDNDPVEVLPIGYTLMGNLILLITDGNERGGVVMKKAFSDEYHFLANGIDEFFGRLDEPSDE